MLLAIFDNRIGNAAIDTRHMLEQSRRSRIDLNTRKVDTRYYHPFKRIGQGFLIDIMLVQAYTNRFGIDLDQFGQRILQAPGNRDRTTLSGIQCGKFLPRHLRGRIH